MGCSFLQEYPCFWTHSLKISSDLKDRLTPGCCLTTWALPSVMGWSWRWMWTEGKALLAYQEPREADKSCWLVPFGGPWGKHFPAAQRGFGWASRFEITPVQLDFCFCFWGVVAVVVLVWYWLFPSFIVLFKWRVVMKIWLSIHWVFPVSLVFKIVMCVLICVFLMCLHLHIGVHMCVLDFFLDCSHHKWRQGLSVISRSCHFGYSGQLAGTADCFHHCVLVLQAGLCAYLVFIWWLLGTQTAVLILA